MSIKPVRISLLSLKENLVARSDANVAPSYPIECFQFDILAEEYEDIIWLRLDRVPAMRRRSLDRQSRSFKRSEQRLRCLYQSCLQGHARA